MSKSHMERNRERIAKVRAENLARKAPRDSRRVPTFTSENDTDVLTWDETDARKGIVVTVRPKEDTR